MVFHPKWIFAGFSSALSLNHKTGFLVFVFGVSTLCSAQNSKPMHVLMLGDSHMVGYFGEHLQRYLHQKGSFHILSVAIGGAGSYTFTSPVLTNSCCGFRIRRTWADDSIGYHSPIRIVSGSLKVDQKPIGSTWSRNLDSLLNYWQPDLLVIELGNNRIDNHLGLIQKIRKYRPYSPIFWVSPFLRSGLIARVSGIQKVLLKDPNARLIPAWDLAGHDTLSSFHMPSAKARKASERLAARICDSLKAGKTDWLLVR
jgi:hypothetical protein